MNPEDAVLDAIAELVDESIAHGPTDDYDREYQERCELCDMVWHGLARWGCPGAFATEEQRTAAPAPLPQFPRDGYTTAALEQLRDLLRWPQRYLLGWQLPDDPFDTSEWLGTIDGAPWVRATTWLPGDPPP